MVTGEPRSLFNIPLGAAAAPFNMKKSTATEREEKEEEGAMENSILRGNYANSLSPPRRRHREEEKEKIRVFQGKGNLFILWLGKKRKWKEGPTRLPSWLLLPFSLSSTNIFVASRRRF